MCHGRLVGSEVPRGLDARRFAERYIKSPGGTASWLIVVVEQQLQAARASRVPSLRAGYILREMLGCEGLGVGSVRLLLPASDAGALY